MGPLEDSGGGDGEADFEGLKALNEDIGREADVVDLDFPAGVPRHLLICF